jgi:hypothetical protein
LKGCLGSGFFLGTALYLLSPPIAKDITTLSAETRQALEEYLELAPEGPHAADVKAMLEMTGP